MCTCLVGWMLLNMHLPLPPLPNVNSSVMSRHFTYFELVHQSKLNSVRVDVCVCVCIFSICLMPNDFNSLDLAVANTSLRLDKCISVQMWTESTHTVHDKWDEEQARKRRKQTFRWRREEEKKFTLCFTAALHVVYIYQCSFVYTSIHFCINLHSLCTGVPCHLSFCPSSICCESTLTIYRNALVNDNYIPTCFRTFLHLNRYCAQTKT